jgi:hypothetical protein
MPEQDTQSESLAEALEETRKASILIPLDDNEAIQALAKYKRKRLSSGTRETAT